MPTLAPVRPSRRATIGSDLSADAELRSEIASQLRLGGFSLQVSVAAGRVTLAGRLETNYERQMALQVVRRIAGVERLSDQIRVAAAPQPRRALGQRSADLSVGLWQAFADWFSDTPKWAWFVIGLAFVVPTTMFSCGGPAESKVAVHPVTGKVSFNGEVPVGAIVTLNPQGGTDLKSAPRATVKPDGTFQVSVYEEGDGAPAGDYVVTVQWFKLISGDGGSGAGPNVLPRQYAKPETSPIKVTVKEEANELPPIEIRK